MALALLILTISYVTIIVNVKSNPHPCHFGSVASDRKLSVTLFIVTLVSILTVFPFVIYAVIPIGKWNHRQPKLILRAAHKLDCFFHAMHNNDIGTLCIIMTSATFKKSLYGNDTKRLKLPQIRKKSE